MNREETIDKITKYEFANMIGIDYCRNEDFCLIIMTPNLEFTIRVNTVSFSFNRAKNEIYKKLHEFDDEELRKIWFKSV